MIDVLNISKTTWPIKAKLHVEHSGIKGTHYCSRYLGQMTKMAVTPIYGHDGETTSKPYSPKKKSGGGGVGRGGGQVGSTNDLVDGI